MADFRRGIKAGAAAAAVYLIISVILATIGREFWYPSGFISAAGLTISLELTEPLALPGSIFGRIVQGVIFGAVFAALYNLLPGTSTIKKALVFSSLLWVLVAVELVYTMAGWIHAMAGLPTDGGQTLWSTTTLPVAGVNVTLPRVSDVLAGIISALVFGALTGFLWDRFRATGLTEARKGSAVLLVSFSLGVWMWASPAVGIIRYVVNEGTLPVGPGPMWWVNILITLAALIGPVGWILALVAWRKSRRGESGLKWGVAGGIIMAMTGLMLLPGALAITGGVLSGHKPASEAIAAVEQQP
jgi:uncharacterized membrane protein (UPF0136 family)